MFKLKENNTTIRTEIFAGFTTFLTMAYIIVVNPAILSAANIPFEQVFTATIIASVVATLWMALCANYPIALAPGMGLNAYFAYSVVGAGIDYRIALASVFVAGLLFLILSLTSFREKLIDMIPNNLKHAISAAIGLFIAFTGLKLSGIIVSDPSNLVGLGDLTDPKIILAFVGIIVTIILIALNINGALFFGMVITGMIAYFMGFLNFGSSLVSLPSLPEGLIISNPIDAFKQVFEHSLYAVVFSFLLVTMFDTTGTVIGVTQQAGLMKDGKLPRARKTLLSDAIGTTIGSMFGTSPTTAFIESSSGIGAGGKTGLTSLTVAILFIFSAFFSPLVATVSNVSAITAPALVIVGCYMMSHVSYINFKDFDEAFPAFLTILMMPLTSSIATGIALGFISYPILKICRGKARDVHPLLYVFGILFFIQLVFLSH